MFCHSGSKLSHPHSTLRMGSGISHSLSLQVSNGWQVRQDKHTLTSPRDTRVWGTEACSKPSGMEKSTVFHVCLLYPFYKLFSDYSDLYTRQVDYGFHQLLDNFSFFQCLLAFSKEYISRLKATFAWKDLDHIWQPLFTLSLLGHLLYLDKSACVLLHPAHAVMGT